MALTFQINVKAATAVKINIRVIQAQTVLHSGPIPELLRTSASPCGYVSRVIVSPSDTHRVILYCHRLTELFPVCVSQLHLDWKRQQHYCNIPWRIHNESSVPQR